MTTRPANERPAAQLPNGDAIFLDHLGWFVAGPEAAQSGLRRLGFAPTPLSVQVNPDPDGGPARLTGTGNVCAMLERGYLELLFKTADAPLGLHLHAARSRYPGLHLAAFAVADPIAWHRHLVQSGFRTQPVVRMERPVETADGPDVAAFDVVRVEPGEMIEGRIQLLRHVTEHTVWQPRWLRHPNSAHSLLALTVVVADVAEAAARFSRFLARRAETTADARLMRLDRGTVRLVGELDWRRRWPDVDIPSLPFMAACTIAVRSLTALRHVLAAEPDLIIRDGTDGLTVRFNTDLGVGIWHFVERQ